MIRQIMKELRFKDRVALITGASIVPWNETDPQEETIFTSTSSVR